MATVSVPMLPLAPGLFSMRNCWPRRSVRKSPIRRAMMSVAPPAGKPTTMRAGFDG
ncbi:hypothetical protein D3C83_316490 [compost metagenome]